MSFQVHAISVAFVNPSHQDNSFWHRVTQIAQAAAKDLNIHLEIHHANSRSKNQLDIIKNICSANNRPDYIILSPWSGNAKASFDVMNEAKIPFVSLERTLRKPEQAVVGFPQQAYPFWLGEVYHDNIHAGTLLADILIQQARKKFSSIEPLVIAGIGGTPNGESNNRILGLKQRVSAEQDVKIAHVLNANWSKEKSQHAIKLMSQRYHDINIIWAASDDMAIAAMDAVHQGETNIDKNNVIVGGIDWTANAIKSIEQGKLDVSVGGHIFQGAWALIQIFDHHRGIKVFKPGEQPPIYKLQAITADNVKEFSLLNTKVDWEHIDFMLLTRTALKDKTVPAFSINAVMNALKGPQNNYH